MLARGIGALLVFAGAIDGCSASQPLSDARLEATAVLSEGDDAALLVSGARLKLAPSFGVRMSSREKQAEDNSEDRETGWVATTPTPEFLAALREGVDKAIRTAGPDFGKALKDLEEAVKRVPSFDLICFNDLYFLTVAAGTNPEFNRPEGIFQHHVELIQAAALRQPIEEEKPEVHNQQGIGDVTEAVTAVVNAFIILETARIARAKTEDETRRKIALASLRLYAAVVRGNAYHSALKPTIIELFRPLDGALSGRLGVGAGSLVEWWWAVSEEVEERLQLHRQAVRSVAELPLNEEWPDRVRELFPRTPGPLDNALVDRLKSDDDQHRAFAIIAGDLNLYQVYGFTFEKLRELYPGDVEPDALKRVLDLWSLRFGDTAGISLGQLLLDNPVVSRPVVQLSDHLFLWSIAAGFHNSAFAMLERLFEDQADLWSAYLDRRAEYLEEAVAAALAQKFPDAKIMTNVYWTNPDDGKRYESDVVVLVDTTVLIAECKGGRLSSHSHRGKGRPLRDDIEDLLVAPGVQAGRLAELLERGDGDFTLTGEDGEAILVDTTRVQRVVTLGTTLEPLAAMLPGLRELVEAGLTNEGLDALAYNITLFDLQIILDILDHPSEVIHYFARRAELEKGEFLSGEETDLLGFYLQTGFNLGEAEFSGEHHMQTFGLSDVIDVYYYSVEAEMEAEKPKVERIEWWEALLSAVENRRLPRWTELGLALCNVAKEDQEEFREAMLELRHTITSGKRSQDDYVLFTNGPPQRRDYFAGLIATDDSSPQRSEQMANVAKQVFAHDEAIDRVILIGWSVIPKPGPYTVLAVCDRGDLKEGPASRGEV